MKKLLFISLLIASCGRPPKPTSSALKIDSSILRDHDSVVAREGDDLPLWASQDINHEGPCAIIPCPDMKIIAIGDTYTATFTLNGMLWYKQDFRSSGIFFGPDVPQWYRDSCELKNDLRPFIKLQMTKYFVARSKQNQ